MTAVAALAALLAIELAPNLTDGTALAKQLAAAYVQQTRGAVTFVVTSHTDVPSVHHVEDSQAAYAYVDGRPVHKRYLLSVVGGKAADREALAKLSAQPEGTLSRFGLKIPMDPAFVSDFRFGSPREAGDMIAVDFSSDVKDESHGDGTLYVRRDGVPDHIIFRPSVLPAHVTGMTLEITYAEVMPDRWDVVRIARTFIGHRGMLSGRVISTSTYAQYRRHPNAPAAVAAIDELEPPASVSAK